MEGIVVGNTRFVQRVYFCRQEIFRTRNTIERIFYHVGLTWIPVDSWSSYSQAELPSTADDGKAKKTFSGKEMFQALKYAHHLSRKYNLPVDLSL